MLKVTHSKKPFMVECLNFVVETPAIVIEAYDKYGKLILLYSVNKRQHTDSNTIDVVTFLIYEITKL